MQIITRIVPNDHLSLASTKRVKGLFVALLDINLWFSIYTTIF